MIKDIKDTQDKFQKILDQADAGLAFFGIKIVTRLQCIRCGILFREDEIALLEQHLEICKLMNKEKVKYESR